MKGKSKLGELGVDTPIEEQIRRHYPGYPESTIGQMLSDPQVALLSILVDEMGSGSTSSSDSGTSNETATYFAEKYTVTSDGPRVKKADGTLEEPEEVDGARVDVGFVANSWDLRFTDDVVVAWQPSNRTHRDVLYRAKDSPVVGKTARSQSIWIKQADSASSNPTLFVEGDVDG